MQILTEAIIHKICKLLEEDELSNLEIIDKLKLYQISENPMALVSAIRNKRIWNNISDIYNIPLGIHGRVFNDGQIREICKMIEHNPYCTSAYILYHLGIDNYNKKEYQQYKNTISAIKHGRRYTYISKDYTFQL